MNTVSKLRLSRPCQLAFDSIAKRSPRAISQRRLYADGLNSPSPPHHSIAGDTKAEIHCQNNDFDPQWSESPVFTEQLRNSNRSNMPFPAGKLQSTPRLTDSPLDRLLFLYRNLQRPRFPAPTRNVDHPNASPADADTADLESALSLLHPQRSRQELPPENLKTLSELDEFLSEFKRIPLEDIPLNDLYRSYLTLPGTRVCYLSRSDIQSLLLLLAQQDLLRH